MKAERERTFACGHIKRFQQIPTGYPILLGLSVHRVDDPLHVWVTVKRREIQFVIFRRPTQQLVITRPDSFGSA
jgi:hypothetical protein